MQHIPRYLLLLALLAPTLAACASSPRADDTVAATIADDTQRTAGQTEASHSNDAEPNYAAVFPQDEVQQITITIAPDDWAAMQANMTELYGEPTGEERGGPGGGGMGGPPPDGEGGPPPGGMGGGPLGTEENPMWVPSTVTFEGQTWTDVGIRYKGNSSLRSSWNSKTLKLPFKLQFDQFEDEVPATEDQRFFGFKSMSFANNWGDAAAMRDTITYDMLENLGLPASETAYYVVTLDYGEGAKEIGLYTVVEETDDTVIGKFFGDDDGNIYKPAGEAATLAAGTEDGIEEDFAKENNQDAADWSDIEALYAALHSPQRTTDPAAWRAELEQVFAVEPFLEWLAFSAAIQHWDTYGAMSHNFYLYDDPDTGKLTWISWDHNLVLGSMGERRPMGAGAAPNVEAAPQTTAQPAAQNRWQGRGGRGGFGRGGTALDKSDTDEDWPLIRFLLDDATYKEQYMGYLAALTAENGVLDAEALTARYNELAVLLRPYAAKETSAASYDEAVAALTSATEQRIKAVNDFLAAQ